MYKLATSLPRLPATLTEERTATTNTNVGLQDVRVCRSDAAMQSLLWRSQRFPKPLACRSKLQRSARYPPQQLRDPRVCPWQYVRPAPSSPPAAPQCSPDLLMLGAASGRRHGNLRRGASAARPRPRCGHCALRAPGGAAAAAASAAPAPGLRRTVPTQKQSKIKAFKIKANLWNF